MQCRRALTLDPRYGEAHNNLGAALASRGRLDDAIGHFRQAVQCCPRFAAAHKNLGTALAGQGRIDDAIAHFRKALEIDPRYAEAHNDLGAALARGGRIDEAVAQYGKALEIRPDYADPHYNLGLILAQQGKTGEAIAQYRKAMKMAPDAPAAWNDLAWLRATCPDPAMRNGAEAIDLARHAIELTGPTPEFLDTLAAAYAEAGMLSQAIQTVGQALELARQQGNPALVEKLKDRLWLYDVVGSPYRDPRQPPAPQAH